MGILKHTIKYSVQGNMLLLLIITFGITSCQLTEENIRDIKGKLERMLNSAFMTKLKSDLEESVVEDFHTNATANMQRLLEFLDSKLGSTFVRRFKSEIENVSGPSEENIQEITNILELNTGSSLMDKIKSKIEAELDNGITDNNFAQVFEIIEESLGTSLINVFDNDMEEILNEDSTTTTSTTTQYIQDENCKKRCTHVWCNAICRYTDSNGERKERQCSEFTRDCYPIS